MAKIINIVYTSFERIKLSRQRLREKLLKTFSETIGFCMFGTVAIVPLAIRTPKL